MLLGDLVNQGKPGLLPRGKSLFNLGDIKPQDPSPTIQPKKEPTTVADLDLPPLFDDEDDFLKNLSNEEKPAPEPQENTEIQRPPENVSRIPPRLLLSSNIRPSASHNSILSPDFTASLSQNSNNSQNDQIDDIFSTPIPSPDTISAPEKQEEYIPPRFETKVVPDQPIPPRFERKLIQEEPQTIQNSQIIEQPPLDIQNKPSVVKEQPKIPINDPITRFEYNLTKSLERSLNNAKRSIIRDTTTYIRYTDSVEQNVFDNFINDLVHEINDFVPSKEAQHPDVKNLPPKLANLLEEGLKPIRDNLDENKKKTIQIRNKQKQDYQDICKSLDILNKTISEITSSTLNELDKARLNIQRETDNHINMARTLERQQRSLKLRASDYENRLQQQTIELESIERLLKQTEAAEKELSETNKNNREAIKMKIQNEMDKLFEIIDNSEEDDTLNAQVNDLSRKTDDMCENIREDLNQTFMLNYEIQNAFRRALHASEMQYERSMNASDMAQSMISAAERIQEKRRIRQLPVNKGAVERFHFMVENEPIENSYL